MEENDGWNVQWEALWSVDVQREESPRRDGDGALMERDALRRGLPGMVMAARVMREMRGLSGGALDLHRNGWGPWGEVV